MNAVRKLATEKRRSIEVAGLEVEVSKNSLNTVFIHKVGATKMEMTDRDVFSMDVEAAQRLTDMAAKSGESMPELTLASVKALPDHTQTLFWIMRLNGINSATEAREVLVEALKLA